MNITLANVHKGVGKSLIAHQLILSYQYRGVEIDPFGVLSRKLPLDVDKIPSGARDLPNYAFMTLFDFGAFYDLKIEMAALQSGLVLIPFTPDFASVEGTIKTIKLLRQVDRPFLFVANRHTPETGLDSIRNVLQKVLSEEPDISVLPESEALADAFERNHSILELADESALPDYVYAAESLNRLFGKIQNYARIQQEAAYSGMKLA